MKLTERQQAAVRYYEGDVSGTDPFWSDPKAYCTLNALLYPGLSTEKARAAEGKRLNSAFLEDPERLLSLCARLFEACEAMKTETAAETWRVERMADFAICRELGHTVSFTSTSRAGFLDAYADRRGIALMHFVIPAGTPCIDLAAALDRYAKEEEAELTLPPFVSLRFTETPVSPAEMTIRDADGNGPQYACIAHCSGIAVPGESAGDGSPGFSREDAAAGAAAYRAWNQNRQPSMEEAARYLRWKNAFRLEARRLISRLCGR